MLVCSSLPLQFLSLSSTARWRDSVPKASLVLTVLKSSASLFLPLLSSVLYPSSLVLSPPWCLASLVLILLAKLRGSPEDDPRNPAVRNVTQFFVSFFAYLMLCFFSLSFFLFSVSVLVSHYPMSRNLAAEYVVSN
ncbi:hypothetical protein NE237_018829 [Protea cynaroides]|uniref:Uncharacterized protein n=1 Tax=Protea cynaroides TaxID=273540 RepID=A0A9Q0KAQ7_9MAGN|nr:hypothetical protein NE237_018829 [Protea cynaroides]